MQLSPTQIERESNMVSTTTNEIVLVMTRITRTGRYTYPTHAILVRTYHMYGLVVGGTMREREHTHRRVRAH